MKQIVDFVLKKEKKPVSLERIVDRINGIRFGEGKLPLTKKEIEEVHQILEDEAFKLDVYKTPSDNYILLSKTSFRKGRFYGDRSGRGKVSVTTSYVDRNGQLVVNEDKYTINRDQTNGAIDGDLVLIDLGGKTNQPKVVSILNRQLDYVPGEVYRMGNSYFVKPIDKKKQNIIIALEGEAIEGERVAVSLEQQTSNNFYIGKIVSTFNHKDDPDEDVLWEAFKHGIDNNFSNESLEQLEHVPMEIRDVDKIGREDLTEWETFTIDGINTKDMDDAVSCRINEKGNFELGVHITDIPAIVPENSPLDLDAFKKGNSCYAGGCVFPMYPHKISNGIGSLNEGKERLTISTIMEFDKEGHIVNYRANPTVIKSQLKMNYNAVNKILKDDVIDPAYIDHKDTLFNMKKLAYLLRKNRLINGSQEYNRPELEAYRDKNTGKIKTYLRIQDVGENLIEEFMIAGNHYLTKLLTDNGIPFLYRVHEAPSEDKITELLHLLVTIGIPFNKYSAFEIVDNKKAFQELNAHIEKNSGRLAAFLTSESIRCNSRAKYSPYNIGHYGLSIELYGHTTSPARRYADTTNQRIIHDCYFNLKDRQKNIEKWKKKLPSISEQVNRTERAADETERDVLRMFCCEEMEDYIGEEFNATVIGISSECMVVQLDDLKEGTVRVRDLKGSYIYSPETYSLVSLDGLDDYHIGDYLKLKLKSTSKENKKMDFTVVEKIDETTIVDADIHHQAVKVKARQQKNGK